MYEYKIKKVLKVYDGDTITVEVDLGFGVTKKEVFRLMYINTPEVRGVEREKGLISRDWLRKRLETDKDIIVKSFKDSKGKYGRYLGEVFIDNISINSELVSLGLAEFKEY